MSPNEDEAYTIGGEEKTGGNVPDSKIKKGE
jgi:hypothetical protein